MSTKKKKPAKRKPARSRKPKTPGRIAKKAAFLQAYTETASVQRAADIVGIHKSLHYVWLKDDEYAGSFAAAQDQAAQILEDEAIRRAHDGVLEPVIWQGQQQYEVIRDGRGEPVRGEDGEPQYRPLAKRKYSNTLLQFLLKAFRPGKYKDRAAVEHSGPGGGPITITDERLAALTDEELDRLIPIAEKLTVTGGAGGREKTPATK